MNGPIICPVCGNTDPTSVFQVGNKIVCKRCIHYVREAITMHESDHEINVGEYELTYALSNDQKRCAKQVLSHIQHGDDVLLWAVCGAGKTEMMMDSIAYTLENGGHVGFLIPRRQVVLEVAQRLGKAFGQAKVVPVCAGYGNDIEGDIVVATTHQAVRYPHAFDLLILDEPDAFPYKGNPILETIVQRTRKGAMIYSTATPSSTILELVKSNRCKVVELNSRYTGKPMVEPRKHIGPKLLLWFDLIHFIISRQRSVLIFVPTIAIAKHLYQWLRPWIKCGVITSKSDDKETIIESFRDKTIPLLIATSILERGVTFIDIDVAIFYADHPVFDNAALQQMVGRVDRHPQYYQGRCVLFANQQTKAINACIERIQYANSTLSMV